MDQRFIIGDELSTATISH